MKQTLLALALVPVLGAQAVGANLGHFTTKDGREVVVLTGEIAAGDADALIATIKASNDASRTVSGLRLNSNGGNLSEGVRIAEAIRYAKIATVVANGAACASACFVAFSAGSEKFVSYNARVGVHGASSNGQETEGSRAATVAMAKIVKELGVPPAIIGQMVVTPPDKVVWLSPADLQSMGVKMTGKPAQVAVVAPAPSPGQPSVIPQTLPAGAASNGAGLAEAGGLASATPAATDRNTRWGQLVALTIAQSSAGNNGAPVTSRICQPELKLCSTAVFAKGQDGKPMMVRITEDIDGKTVARHVCTFNDYGDVRNCLDWDSGAISREMKDAAGSWSAVVVQ